jgi:hypothetical protein
VFQVLGASLKLSEDSLQASIDADIFPWEENNSAKKQAKHANIHREK